jgi:hypothetical protein
MENITKNTYLPPSLTNKRSEAHTSGWNSRFHLESIPRYDALQDKNCLAFKNYYNKFVKTKKRRALTRHQTAVPSMRPNLTLKNIKGLQKRTQQIKQDFSETQDLLFKGLKQYWSRMQVDPAVQELYKDIFYKIPIKVSAAVVANEVDCLSKDKSILQVNE